MPSVAGSGLDRLLTIPVAPGVVRIVGDPAGHDLTGGRVREVEIDAEGTIWVVQGRRVIALGTSGAIVPRAKGWQAFPRQLSMTRAGEMLALEDGGSVVQAQGRAWADRSDGLISTRTSLGVLDDGSVWRVVRTPDGPNRIARLTSDGWTMLETPELETLLTGRGTEYSFARTADERVWLGVDQGHRGGGLAVFEDGTWTEVQSLGPVVAPRVLNVVAGHDGTLWALLNLDTRSLRAATANYLLARLDSSGWTVYSASDGLPQGRSGIWIDQQPALPTPMVVAPDGTVWFSIERVGLVSFDGTSFERIGTSGLRAGALDLAIDLDGAIWVASTGGGLYVMTPETDREGPAASGAPRQG